MNHGFTTRRKFYSRPFPTYNSSQGRCGAAELAVTSRLGSRANGLSSPAGEGSRRMAADRSHSVTSPSPSAGGVNVAVQSTNLTKRLSHSMTSFPRGQRPRGAGEVQAVSTRRFTTDESPGDTTDARYSPRTSFARNRRRRHPGARLREWPKWDGRQVGNVTQYSRWDVVTRYPSVRRDETLLKQAACQGGEIRLRGGGFGGFGAM